MGFWIWPLKLKHKLILSASLAAVIVGGFSLAGYAGSLGRFTELLYEQTAVSLGVMASQLSGRISELSDLSAQAALNPQVQRSLLSLVHESDPISRRRARSAVAEELYKYLGPDVISISILVDSGGPIVCGLDSSPASQETIDALKDEAVERRGGEAWIESGSGDGSILCVREIRKPNEPHFLMSLGFLVLRVDLGGVVGKITQSSFLDAERLLVSGWKGNRLYPESGGWEAFVPEGGKEYTIQVVNGKETLLTGKRLYDITPPWDMTAAVSCEAIFKPIRLTAGLTLAMILGGVALSLAAAALVSQSIDGEFQLLAAKMARLKRGELEPMPNQPKPTGDELGLLSQHFDEMALEFKKLIDENYVRQLQAAETRLKLLQQQMDPHFLFNTLDSINWFAKRSGDESVRVMVEALGGFLRGNLDQDDGLVTLAEELATLECYIRIQKIRHGDMLETEFRTERAVMEALLPRLSIQPLVENAVTYSMEECIDGCMIVVKAERAGEDVLITVENTGSEIDEGILEKLKSGEARARGHGIGLLSIDERTKLLFGQKYGLRFKSQPDLTSVSLLIPFTTKESGACDDEDDSG